MTTFTEEEEVNLEMKVSEYGQSLLCGSTCCHKVALNKDNKVFIGIYNGLSYWGRVEDGQGNLVEELSTEWEDDKDTGPQSYQPCFSERDFTDSGYQVIK